MDKSALNSLLDDLLEEFEKDLTESLEKEKKDAIERSKEVFFDEVSTYESDNYDEKSIIKEIVSEKYEDIKQFALPKHAIKYFQNKYIPPGVGKRVIADFE